MKQKDIPRELLINGNIWKIKFVRNIKSDVAKTKETLGICDPSDKTIYIKQGQPYLERIDTVIHEILHSAEEEFGFELEHKTVYLISRVLAKIYLDNF